MNRISGSAPRVSEVCLAVQVYGGKKIKERDECNLTAHNILLLILCPIFSVILSQLKNRLMLMRSDLEIKHQSASLLVDGVLLSRQPSPTGRIAALERLPLLFAHRKYCKCSFE